MLKLLLKIWRKISDLVIDGDTGMLVSINDEHHEIHSGESYSLYVVDSDLDTAQSIDITFTTPNSKTWAHMVMDAEVTGEANIYIYEGANTDDDGAAITIRNRNRNHNAGDPEQSEMTATLNDTVNAAGTEIYNRQIGSGRKVGGRVRALEERILKKNTKYLFRVTSVGDNNIVNVELDWYEHENKGSE